MEDFGCLIIAILIIITIPVIVVFSPITCSPPTLSQNPPQLDANITWVGLDEVKQIQADEMIIHYHDDTGVFLLLVIDNNYTKVERYMIKGSEYEQVKTFVDNKSYINSKEGE